MLAPTQTLVSKGKQVRALLLDPAKKACEEVSAGDDRRHFSVFTLRGASSSLSMSSRIGDEALDCLDMATAPYETDHSDRVKPAA